jgi:zinc carboxypeptidase
MTRFGGRARKAALAALCGALVVLAAVPSGASPVCADEPRTPCGDRIFAEAETTVSFVQHDSGEYLAGIEALERDFPRFVRVRSFEEIFGPSMVSAGGRAMQVVEITDFDAPESKKVAVLASLSVHGAERAGLEGGVRYMEDLARWAAADEAHELRNGTEKDSIGIDVKDALRKVHVYFADVNPDGWAAGDQANGGVFMRGNDNGVDLNRQFPTTGWMDVGRALPETESEAKAMIALERKVDPLITTDIHGELTSEQNAFADMMYPAGQWNPRRRFQQERLARHMASNVRRYFEEQGVEAGEAAGVADMKPAQYATGYDVVGYDDSGFMGDYFTQRGAIDMDVEHFLSHMVPNSTWAAPLEEAHIMAVRGELETLIVEATVVRSARPTLRLGRVGYLFDRKVVKSADGYGGPNPPPSIEPRSYRSTRMQYFRDLSSVAKPRLRRIWSDKVTARALRRLDTLVVADRPFPRTSTGKKAPARKLTKAVGRWVRKGGNLVLTDKAIKMLRLLKVVPGGAISNVLYNAGHVNVETWDDPYMKGVHTTASQTYYEVPLGFSLAQDTSPHWIVARDAWEKAGGKVVAYVTDEAQVGIGRVPVGKGSIGIFGAILPTATEKYDHLYGLADYAITVAGGQILDHMIGYGR